MHTEHRDQASFCPFALREVSVLAELALGHLRYYLTDVPPQSNSPPGSVLESDHAGAYDGDLTTRPAPEGQDRRRLTPLGTLGSRTPCGPPRLADGARVPPDRVSKETMKVVVFQIRRRTNAASHLCYTSHVSLQCQTRVKLNRVFFPR